MLQVRDGEVGQLGVLFERHHGPLFGFFVRLTSNRAVSEDLVQDVFLRMLKYRHTYRGDNRFTYWMYQIARNSRADYYRKRKREVLWNDDLPEPASDAPIAIEDLERGQEVALLRAALAELPEDRRELLVLARFQKLHYEEIAEILGCTTGAVKVRVHRAIKELREVYFRVSKEKRHEMRAGE
jgi:RNA polymerase sigma-70 factor (ECF subfamily)